jgi:hypothetical protein
MPAPKGTRPPNAGKGRKPGQVNASTKAIKEMILGALDRAGGEEYLVSLATKNPAAFVTLLTKVLPTQVTGDPENPVISAITVQYVRAEGKD